MMHKFHPDWGTHIPVLVKCLQQGRGIVLELGMGISSTPLLHAICADQDRFLASYDNDLVFVDMFKKYRTHRHEIKYIENWDELDIDCLWGLALVDHKPERRRVEEIKKLADKATFIVIHDSEPDKDTLYNYDEIYPLFKYRYTDSKQKVHTTVLSNFNDLNFLHNSKS